MKLFSNMNKKFIHISLETSALLSKKSIMFKQSGLSPDTGGCCEEYPVIIAPVPHLNKSLACF